MTRQTQSNELDAIVQLLADHGFGGMAEAMEILLNEAMRLQRSEALRAGPYERTRERRGHALRAPPGRQDQEQEDQDRRRGELGDRPERRMATSADAIREHSSRPVEEGSHEENARDRDSIGESVSEEEGYQNADGELENEDDSAAQSGGDHHEAPRIAVPADA